MDLMATHPWFAFLPSEKQTKFNVMTDKTTSMNTLLENYVFMVASHYIDQVDTELQTRLINLLLEVGREPRQDDLASPEVILGCK
ncbi:hypothetical protein GCM10028805_56060 [Spirosoma harenae]